MKVLSVVCARTGSKGLENKCVQKVNDKMIVEYSVEYSLSLGKDVKTVVSTDINELMQYCKKRDIAYIKRDPKYCTDKSKIDDSLANAIEKVGDDCLYCSLVYGNIPVRYPELFHKALNFLEEHKDFDAVFSMQNVEKFHPAWMFDYNEDVLALEEERHYRRQSLPQKMIHDGHTIIFRSKDFYNRYKGLVSYNEKYRYSIFGKNIKPLINSELIIDIDTEKDMKLAEAILIKL